MSDNEMLDLVLRFQNVLNNREGILVCFCDQGVQLEGWLKGELLYFLTQEKADGRISSFDREARFDGNRGRVDIRIDVETNEVATNAWVELKHWLIGYQRGTRWGARDYFGDASSVGIKPDAQKLIAISSGKRYILVMTTSNPGTDHWSAGVELFNQKFHPLRVETMANPEDFPHYYFLGLLKVV
jgi:hypothetical protein